MTRKIFTFAFFLIATTVTVIMYWFLYDQPLIGIDDSNIYFVYAKNLIEGHGLVYNPGGENVEGFTSMFWLLIISGFYAISENYEMMLMAFTGLLIAFTLYKTASLLDLMNDARRIISPTSFFLPGALFLVPGYIDWTVITLMETGLWSVLIILFTTTISFAVLMDNLHGFRFVYAILSALMIVTRPESLLWAPVFIVFLVVMALLKEYNIRSAIKLVLPGIILSAVTLIGLTIFRLQYFGYPLPNTYYAKVSSDTLYNIFQGVRYFIRACIKLPFLFVVSCGVGYSGLTLLRKALASYRQSGRLVFSTNERVQLLLTGVSLISLLIPVVTGGDHFHMARFYQPYFPIYLATALNITFWQTTAGLNLSIPDRTPTYVWMSLVLFFLYTTPKIPLHDYIDVKSPIAHEFRLAELGRENGESLNTMFENVEKPGVGVSAAGGFAYGYTGETVDLMGLNNIAMAHAVADKKGIKNHAAFDIPTFFTLNPEIFHGYKKLSFFIVNDSLPPLLEDSGLKSFTFANNMYKGLLDDRKFVESYFPVIITYKDLKYTTYMRKDYIQYLQKEGFEIEIRPSERRKHLMSEFYGAFNE